MKEESAFKFNDHKIIKSIFDTSNYRKIDDDDLNIKFYFDNELDLNTNQFFMKMGV